MAISKLKCVVVTPETTVLETEADFVALPALDGELGVMAGRMPMVARLGHGLLRVKGPGGEKKLFVSGGFAQIQSNIVTLLTPVAVDPGSVAPAEIQKKLDAAKAETASTPEGRADLARRVSSLRAQLRLAQS